MSPFRRAIYKNGVVHDTTTSSEKNVHRKYLVNINNKIMSPANLIGASLQGALFVGPRKTSEQRFS